MHISKFKGINLFNIVLFLLALTQYSLLTPLNAPDDKYLPTAVVFDSRFGLIPGFIVPYLSVYLLLLFLIILLLQKRDNNLLTIFLFSAVFLWSLINLIHGFLPTINSIRPEIKESGIFFSLVNFLYESVRPYRTLPSWTAATAILCAIAFSKVKFKFSKYLIVWVFLICISPLFLKMAYILDVVAAIPLPFICYAVSEKIWNLKIKKEAVQEVVRVFTFESLLQSAAVGIRDESTMISLIEGLNRVEKNLTEKDIGQIKQVGLELNPPVCSLKEVINNLVLSIRIENKIEKAREIFGKDKSYVPTHSELKHAYQQNTDNSCKPFENVKFRNTILEIKRRNTELINTTSIEEAARERSRDIIFRFKSFIDSNKKNIPAIHSICNGINGHSKVSFREIKHLTSELRRPPYEISADEIWNAYYRINNKIVKPLGEQKNMSNIIPLTQFAIGRIDSLEPFGDKVDKNFNDWLTNYRTAGKTLTEEQMEWLRMMKDHVAKYLEINMASLDDTPFVNKGGAAKALSILGPDLNIIIHEFNEKLI